MNKVIFVGFDTEQKAYEADRAVRDMHRDGTLTLYNDAVVVKERGGKVVVRRAPESDPVGTVGGMLTGGLIGLLGGPVGAAVGLGTGTLIGAAFDLTEEGVEQDFVEDAGAGLEAGKAALIAEIDEQWQVPLDTRMEALGGNLLRQTRTQIEDAYAERAVRPPRESWPPWRLKRSHTCSQHRSRSCRRRSTRRSGSCRRSNANSPRRYKP